MFHLPYAQWQHGAFMCYRFVYSTAAVADGVAHWWIGKEAHRRSSNGSTTTVLLVLLPVLLAVLFGLGVFLFLCALLEYRTLCENDRSVGIPVVYYVNC